MIDINKLWPEGVTKMAGTEKTYRYEVVVASSRGRLGVRKLPDGTTRIRVEVAEAFATQTMIDAMAQHMPRSAGWKQYGDQDENRFSIMRFGGADAEKAITDAKKALGEGKLKTFADFSAPTQSTEVSTET